MSFGQKSFGPTSWLKVNCPIPLPDLLTLIAGIYIAGSD